VTVAIDSEME